MKQFFATAAAGLMAFLLLVSCGKEPVTPTEPPDLDFTYETVDNTSWQGSYNTYINSPYGGSFPMVMEWTVDFNGNGKGLVYLHIESPAISPIDEEMPITNYTYHGDNTGTFDFNTHHYQFAIDGLNRTMEVDSLRFGLELDDSGRSTYFGGKTTLRQTR